MIQKGLVLTKDHVKILVKAAIEKKDHDTFAIYSNQLDSIEKDFLKYKTELLTVTQQFEEFGDVPTKFYPTIDEAYKISTKEKISPLS